MSDGGRQPSLVDCHMHTPLCGHAVGDPVEYARQAAERGIDLITVTCHIPMAWRPFGQAGVRMGDDDLGRYVEMVREAAETAAGWGVEVRLGIEAEVHPDDSCMESMDRTLARHPFDYVLGSLHHQCRSYRLWLERNKVRDEAAIIDSYFRHLRDGAQSGRYDSMSHPDVIRIYGTVSAFEPSEHEAVIREFLEAAAEEDVCLEVNTSGLSKGVYVVHPDPLILDWAREAGVKLTLGSDAHHPESVGQHFESVLPMLREKGFEHIHFFRNRRRERTPIPALGAGV